MACISRSLLKQFFCLNIIRLIVFFMSVSPISPGILRPYYAFNHPLLLMISLEGGVNIYSKTLNGKISNDPHLICGGLNALSLFLKEVLDMEDPIKRIILDEYEIFITNVNDITLYYMFIGDEEESIGKLAEFINEMTKKRYWSKFNNGKFEISTRMVNILDKMVTRIFMD